MDYMGVFILMISFISLLVLGVPVAFSIGISGVLTMLVSIDSLPAFTTFAHRMATGLDSFSLLAIPFFVLAGNIMNSGGIALRLVNLAKIFVGKWPAGLAFVNVFANMLFGAISGSAVASASAIGSIMGPEMKKEGYDERFSAAVNISSSTTGLSIPPSNILIVYSLASGGTSITALFLAGYIPGLLTGLSLMIMAMSMMVYKNKGAKGVGYVLLKFLAYTLAIIGVGIGLKMASNQSMVLSNLLWIILGLGISSYISYRVVKSPTKGRYAFTTFWNAIPSLFLLIVVIGGIVAGFFTATEASAVAVLYALILALIYKEINIQDIPTIVLKSVKTTSIVLMLVACCMGLSWIMAFENIPQTVSAGMLQISDRPFMILLMINMILLFVGIFMDITPSVLIFTPIFLPIVMDLGIDPVHFGIIMVMNLSVGICTPPVGSVLFVGCSVSGLKIEEVLKPLLPMFLVMILTLLLVTYVPALSMWLPEIFTLK